MPGNLAPRRGNHWGRCVDRWDPPAQCGLNEATPFPLISAQYDDPLSRSGKTPHTSLPVPVAVGHRVGLHSGPKLEGEWHPSRARRHQVEGTRHRGLRIVFSVSRAFFPVFGKCHTISYGEWCTDSGGEIRVCRNYHPRVPQQCLLMKPLSTSRRRKVAPLPSDTTSRTPRRFCEYRTIPT
jgi:hypothetical protein